MRVLLLCVVLGMGGCARPAPPPVFPVPIPPADPLEPIEVEPEAGECVDVVPYRPGMAPECSGLVVPPVFLAELRASQEAAPYYLEKWQDDVEGRERDRLHAEHLVQQCAVELKAEKRANDVARWAIPIGLGVAIAFGFMAGYELGSL